MGKLYMKESFKVFYVYYTYTMTRGSKIVFYYYLLDICIHNKKSMIVDFVIIRQFSSLFFFGMIRLKMDACMHDGWSKTVLIHPMVTN